MRVIQLKAENVLRLRAVEITPSGDVVKITGANGNGKTSVLDSIWLCLDQRRVGAEVPIHRGAKKATIKLNLGEIKVERTITPSGGELKVFLADGTKVTSPQKFLDGLIGELSFDPLAFERMKPVEQFEQLRHMASVDIDFGEIARKNQADFDRRTEINRQAKVKRAQLEAWQQLPGVRDLKPIDEAPLIQKINSAGEHNAQLEVRKAKRDRVSQEAAGHMRQATEKKERCERLREELSKLKGEIAAHEETAAALDERIAEAAPLPAPVDVSAVTAELVEAQQHNAGLVQHARKQEVENAAEDLERAAEELTEAIEGRNAAKEQALAAVKLPVTGLGLGEGMVLFNGLPFAQASSAERLRVGMAIAMAANDKIRIIRISDGSLLDSKSMAIIGEMARDNDYQVWCEVVDESKKVGIVIEDGAVVAVNE